MRARAHRRNFRLVDARELEGLTEILPLTDLADCTE
jgi:hypothetical protein